jgi:hypothetical protein
VTVTRLLLAHRRLAVLICAAALLLKLLVPAGWMVDGDGGRVRITVCSGVMATPMPETSRVHAAMPEHGRPGDRGRAEMPCAFAGLSAAVAALFDPVRLDGLSAFVAPAASVAKTRPTRPSAPRLRPPLRAPPALK